MALESKAKGWCISEIDGPEEFLRASVRESIVMGLVVFGVSKEAEKIVAEEWERLGGGKRESLAEENYRSSGQEQDIIEIAPKTTAEKLSLSADRPSGQPGSKHTLPDPERRVGGLTLNTTDSDLKAEGGPEHTPERPHGPASPKSAAGQSKPDSQGNRFQPKKIETPMPNLDQNPDEISDDVSGDEWEFEYEWLPPLRRDDPDPSM